MVMLFAISDSITHSWNRKRARHRATLRGIPPRVVVVCYGNICRSPFAKAYLLQRLGELGLSDVEIDSAGLYGPDRPANTQAKAAAHSFGLDLAGHKSRLFLGHDTGQATLVLAMTRSQRNILTRQFGVPQDRIELLGDFDVEDPPSREIADPYGQSDEQFKAVFNGIARSIDGLCAIWASYGRSQAGSEPPVQS